MKKVVVLIALFAASTLVYSQKKSAAKGEQIFQQLCVGCHGPDAKAQTEIGKKIQAADLTSAVVQDQRDSQLESVIRNGRGKMPTWSDKLSDDDIKAVVAYIRQFRLREKE